MFRPVRSPHPFGPLQRHADLPTKFRARVEFVPDRDAQASLIAAAKGNSGDGFWLFSCPAGTTQTQAVRTASRLSTADWPAVRVFQRGHCRGSLPAPSGLQADPKGADRTRGFAAGTHGRFNDSGTDSRWPDVERLASDAA